MPLASGSHGADRKRGAGGTGVAAAAARTVPRSRGGGGDNELESVFVVPVVVLTDGEPSVAAADKAPGAAVEAAALAHVVAPSLTTANKAAGTVEAEAVAHATATEDFGDFGD